MPRAVRDTILVVEDDPRLRALYRTTLMAAGTPSSPSRTALTPFGAFETDPPSLLLLDLALPRLNGRDVQREIAGRADTQHLPIVVVSGTETRDLNGCASAPTTSPRAR